jgi:hypothetical protein
VIFCLLSKGCSYLSVSPRMLLPAPVGVGKQIQNLNRNNWMQDTYIQYEDGNIFKRVCGPEINYYIMHLLRNYKQICSYLE